MIGDTVVEEDGYTIFGGGGVSLGRGGTVATAVVVSWPAEKNTKRKTFNIGDKILFSQNLKYKGNEVFIRYENSLRSIIQSINLFTY